MYLAAAREKSGLVIPNPFLPEATMKTLRMKLDDLTVETFEISEEQEDRVLHGAVKTFDPTRCEPHSCMPTFPC